MSSFQKKIMRYAKKQESMAHTKGGKVANRDRNYLYF